MKRLHRTQYLFRLASLMAMATMVAACGGSDDGPAAPSPAPSPAPAPGPAPAPAPGPAPSPSPSPAPAPTAGAASECLNPAQLASGTQYQLDYVVSGALTGTSSTTGNIGAATSFNGHANVLPITQTVVTNYTAPVPVQATVNMTSYQSIEGFDILSYGSVGTVSVPMVGNIETRIVYNPPVRDKRFTLAPLSSYTIEQSGTTTITPPGTSQSTTGSTTVTFSGQESVTVPAGTYTACKFHESTAGATTTLWVIKGKGVLARSVTPSSSGEVILQLQGSSRLNGAAI
jgi:hypothetical protein